MHQDFSTGTQLLESLHIHGAFLPRNIVVCDTIFTVDRDSSSNMCGSQMVPEILAVAILLLESPIPPPYSKSLYPFSFPPSLISRGKLVQSTQDLVASFGHKTELDQKMQLEQRYLLESSM